MKRGSENADLAIIELFAIVTYFALFKVNNLWRKFAKEKYAPQKHS
jgi:hypothetical protein